jgi:hydroxyacylglutathione hydrolase
MAGRLHLRAFTLGPWQTNCYLVWRDGLKSCWVIDASFGPGPMIAAMEKEGLTPTTLVLTHAHVDHIAGVAALRQRWPDLKILLHGAEEKFLSDPVLNLSAATPLRVTSPPADRFMTHGEKLDMDGIEFEVRHTPGHSPGGVCLYAEKVGLAFVGDTLFYDSVGRSDFPTSNGAALMKSIREQLLTLPDETRIFPGHGQATTIGRERVENPFISEG